MIHNEKLTESNVTLYAARCYDNPSCFDTEEFVGDLNRFKYLKRLFNRYEETGDLKERLILNHIIILHNVFGIPATTRMLFLKMREQAHLVKPFLVLMGVMPDRIENIGNDGETIYSSDITMDQGIIEVLRRI